MAGNPFDQIMDQLATIRETLERIKYTQDNPPDRGEWEAINNAMERRQKSRKALLDLVKAGKVRCLRKPSPGGHLCYLLSVADLDLQAPVLTKKIARRLPRQPGNGLPEDHPVDPVEPTPTPELVTTKDADV